MGNMIQFSPCICLYGLNQYGTSFIFKFNPVFLFHPMHSFTCKNQRSVYQIQHPFKFLEIQYFVMNMAEKAEDVDYEPDVLKFKKIWEEMKETSKPKLPKDNSHEAPKNKSKIQPKTKDHSRTREKSKQTKKQTILSQKNVVRNPKHNPEMVIDVMTNPLGYYKDSLKNQKNNLQKQYLIQTASHPSAVSEINLLKKSVQEKDYELSLLRVNNTVSQDRIKALQAQIAERDERISELEARQRELLSRNNALIGGEKIFDYGKVQYENFKNDTRRLLKMLQTTNEYQQFANLALDDNGVRFLNTVNKKVKSAIDSKQKSTLHFCTCNKEFIPESGFWVPEKVYSYGKQFVKQRSGELTQAELQLLLYDLNKIWREREKRIINTLNSQKAKEVDFLKRKLVLHKSNSAKE